jgi:hypothetical protein
MQRLLVADLLVRQSQIRSGDHGNRVFVYHIMKNFLRTGKLPTNPCRLPGSYFQQRQNETHGHQPSRKARIRLALSQDAPSAPAPSHRSAYEHKRHTLAPTSDLAYSNPTASPARFRAPLASPTIPGSKKRGFHLSIVPFGRVIGYLTHSTASFDRCSTPASSAYRGPWCRKPCIW